MNATSGAALGDLAHLRQSVRDILTTPTGSRVMRRDYGSDLFQLVDRPMNDALVLDIYTAAIEALERWEPRLTVERVRIASAEVGRLALDIEGIYRPDGRAVTLEGIIIE